LKVALRFITVLCLALTAISATAQILYDNGPVNGTANAWQISDGLIVSNSFRCCRVDSGPSGGAAMLAGFDFYAWVLASPDDTPKTVDWSITSLENGGTIFGSGTVDLTSQLLFTNGFGYDIFKETANVVDANIILGSGMYWLNLQNATTENGNTLYWDQNSGVGCMSPGCPSEASSNEVGTIPSESFDIFGPGGATPEPGSIVLLGSGMLVLAQARRLKSKFWSNSRSN
jgi:PEP-CTERM motif